MALTTHSIFRDGRSWLAFLAIWACAAGPAQAETLKRWRAQVARVRALADNHVASAYNHAVTLQALPADAGGVDQVRALTLLARLELYLARTDNAALHAEQARTLAARLGDRVGQVEADLVLALNTVNQGRIGRLEAVVGEAVKLAGDLQQPVLQAEVALRRAMLYQRQGRFEEAVPGCAQSLDNARRARLPLALAYSHHCMALAAEQGGNARDALRRYAEMAAAARQAGSRMLLAQAITGQAAALQLSRDYRRAEPLLRVALQLYREIGAPFCILNAQGALAYNRSHQGRHAEALRLRSEVVAGFERNPNQLALWWALMGRAQDYTKLGNPIAARVDAERAYRLATGIGMSRYVSDSGRLLASLAAQRGDYTSAYGWLAEADALTAKAVRDKLSTQVNETTARYELEAKQRHIDVLLRSNLVQQAELDSQRLQQRWLWTVLAGIAALTLCSLAFAARLRHSNAVIARLNAELEAQVARRTSALRQQASYLRVLIDTLPFSVWLKDTAGRYLAVNRNFAAARGSDVARIVGQDDRAIAPSRADELAAEDRVVMASRHARTVERMEPGAGGPVWTETFRAAVIDEEGSVLGTVGFAVDISARKQADAAREAALAEAQRLACLRKDFLAQMSHELRTPLNAILGYAQMLRSDGALSASQTAGVQVIHDSGEHLLTMIDDLLDSAKIDAGKLKLQRVPVALRRCVAVWTDMVRMAAEQKGLEVVCQIDDAVPFRVLADEQRLRQALLNLLANAIKFTDHGQVIMRVRALPAGRVRFEVIDTGVGIAADQLDRIFLPFEQAGDSARRKRGTGLGLWISRRFVCLLGGEIAVESTPGAGSRFWFELALPQLEGPRAGNGARPAVSHRLPAPVPIPPPAEMAVLRRLAELGNMRDVLAYAAQLAALPPGYAGFAEQLRALAEGYQSQALLRLIEQHLDTERSAQ